jgi:hypothetical protein
MLCAKTASFCEVIAALLAMALWLPESQAAPPAITANSRSESLIKPVVVHFDFEESDAAPNSLPHNFIRNIAPSQGFPNFGSMRLTNETAHSGSSSFLFELAGGSMSASVPTSIIPILPLVDYQVSARVRTEGLVNSGVRLVAWLHDKAGQPIPASRAQSLVIRSNGTWDSLHVNVRGDFPDAADLVLELQLVQPGHRTAPLTTNNQPRPQDVGGRAWFDDVIVAHVPRVSLSLPQPGNIVHWPDQPAFEIRVNELSNHQLTARLRVFDIDDQQVFDSSFPAPRGRQAGIIPVALERFGWHRAVLEVTGSEGELRKNELMFAYLSRSTRRTAEPSRFGILLDDVTHQQVATVSMLTTELASGFAVVPVWHADTGTHRDQQRQIAMRELIERLMQADVDLVFSMQQIPNSLADTLGLKKHQVAGALARDSKYWRPYLDDLLVSFGLEVRRWLIGSPLHDEFETDAEVQKGMNAAFTALGEFVPDPQLMACRPLEYAPTDDQSMPVMFIAPHHISPQAIEDYLNLWDEGDRPVTIFLDELPTTIFSRRARVVDLLHRALYAWRIGSIELIIHAPWISRDATGESVMPDAAFCAWDTLVEQFNGRSFAGELPLAPGAHCWLLKGLTPKDSALVAWCDDVSEHSANVLRTQLAHGPVEAMDIFGNVMPIEPIGSEHTVPLTETPVFITNVDLDLVQFRGSMTIAPGFMPAISKLHEHELLMVNPWETPASGTVRLSTSELLTITPSIQDFSIPPGGQIRLPLQIVPDRGIVGGRKRITAEVLLQSDRKQSLQVDLDLEVGLKNIDMTATWTTSRNPLTNEDDLLVSAAVTNKGEQRSTLDVYLMAEGVGQNRRTIAGLGPGETAVRTFRIHQGAALLAGQQIRVGVAERDGLTRLNQVLTIAPH